MELDPVRLRVLALLKERGSDLRKASLAMGRNAAYIHQYLYRGSPKVLSEDDRIALAEHLGVDEDELRHQKRARPKLAKARAAQPKARRFRSRATEVGRRLRASAPLPRSMCTPQPDPARCWRVSRRPRTSGTSRMP